MKKSKKFTALLMTLIMVIACIPTMAITASAKTAPGGAKEYKGHTYYVYSGKVTWKKAKALCEARGGHLATITSSGENKFIKKLIDDKDIDAWLGATDEAKEGTWKWVTGEKWNYTNWNYSQPDNANYGTEHYLMYWSGSGYGWNDYCNDTSNIDGYVCEWDMSKAKVDGVRFASTSANVYYGSTTTLKLLNNTKKVTWSTSNKAVATVSSKGVVTGKGLGRCTITAKIGSKSYKCKVTCIDRNQKASVSLKTSDGGIFIYGTNSAVGSFRLKSYSAAKATVYIVNTDGKSVYKKTFTKPKKGTTYKITWNGKDTKGKAVAAGSYRMKVVVGKSISYSSYISFKTKNDFSGGNGSKNTPFLVTKASQLPKLVKYPKAYYKQTKNIDFNYGGINGLFSEDSQFSGVYDGNSKTISNMIASSPLFKYIGAKGTVKNLNFYNCSVVGEDAAILVFTNNGKISGCKFTKCAISASGNDGWGGTLAVKNFGSITNCSTNGAVNSSGEDNQIGGLVGGNYSTGKIINCTSTVNLHDEGCYFSNEYIGGIVGVNNGVITNSEASGTLTANGNHDDAHIGGVTGYNSGTVTSSYYTGSTVCSLVGKNVGVLV